MYTLRRAPTATTTAKSLVENSGYAKRYGASPPCTVKGQDRKPISRFGSLIAPTAIIWERSGSASSQVGRARAADAAATRAGSNRGKKMIPYVTRPRACARAKISIAVRFVCIASTLPPIHRIHVDRARPGSKIVPLPLLGKHALIEISRNESTLHDRF